MLTPIEKLLSEDEAWQQKCEDLNNANTLSSMVWIAWQMGLWVAHLLLEENLNQHAQRPSQWGSCSKVISEKEYTKRI